MPMTEQQKRYFREFQEKRGGAIVSGTSTEKERESLTSTAPQIEARYRMYLAERQKVQANGRLSVAGKQEELQALKAAYEGDVDGIWETALEAKTKAAEKIGPVSKALEPPAAGQEELTRWEIKRSDAARRILPRLEKAAGDPQELFAEVQSLAQRAVKANDRALAAAIRDEYPWLIPDDTWGLDATEAQSLPQRFEETLDQILAAFIPVAEQEKQQRLRELEKDFAMVKYFVQAAREAADGDDTLILADLEGNVMTVDG